MDFDVVMPLYKCRWVTRSVVEGLVWHYQPRTINIVTLADQVPAISRLSASWDLKQTSLEIYNEDTFFPGLPKVDLLNSIHLKKALYQPGWFYQQLLKLGAPEGIANLTTPYLVWDSDLLPVEAWPVTLGSKTIFALLQHKSGGNPKIVAKWKKWTEKLLNVPFLVDKIGTFVPHHMWFYAPCLDTLKVRIKNAFPSSHSWQEAMITSITTYETFSEYWAYISLAASIDPKKHNYYPYSAYGETTERFFDDGHQRFASALQVHLERLCNTPETAASYREMNSFIESAYEPGSLPSSIAFEANTRHLQKDKSTLHIEETRSKWNPRTKKFLRAQDNR